MKNNSANYFACFGFGSLVNRNTLSPDIAKVHRVTLKGWRRHWQARPQVASDPTDMKSIALLSIHRDTASEIDGLLIVEPVKSLQFLDQREVHYQKHALEFSDFEFHQKPDIKSADLPVHTYISNKGAPQKEGISILRSYLDVVMQGFYREFGEDGLARFVATTDNFQIALREDRRSPIYPRHQSVTDAEIKMFEKIFANRTGTKK